MNQMSTHPWLYIDSALPELLLLRFWLLSPRELAERTITALWDPWNTKWDNLERKVTQVSLFLKHLMEGLLPSKQKRFLLYILNAVSRKKLNLREEYLKFILLAIKNSPEVKNSKSFNGELDIEGEIIEEKTNTVDYRDEVEIREALHMHIAYYEKKGYWPEQFWL